MRVPHREGLPAVHKTSPFVIYSRSTSILLPNYYFFSHVDKLYLDVYRQVNLVLVKNPIGNRQMNTIMQTNLPLLLRDDHMSGHLLKKAIERRGVKKKHVADRKGITASTLARQLSGKHSLSLRDIREYSEILDCPYEELLLDIAPVRILGHVSDISRVNLLDASQKIKQILPPYSIPPNYVGLENYHQNQLNLYLFDQRHMHMQTIDPCCYKAMCVMKVTQKGYETAAKQSTSVSWTHTVFLGYLYPEPDNLYTMSSLAYPGSQYTGLELAWAAPILAYHYNPFSLGWQNVE